MKIIEGPTGLKRIGTDRVCEGVKRQNISEVSEVQPEIYRSN